MKPSHYLGIDPSHSGCTRSENTVEQTIMVLLLGFMVGVVSSGLALLWVVVWGGRPR